MAEQALFEATGVGWRLSRFEGGAAILEGCSLSIAEGSWISLVGPNGAGKTTLARRMLDSLPEEELAMAEAPQAGSPL